jgi:hypothetical protein
MHIRVLEIAGEDLLEILPSIDDVSQQIIQPGPGGILQVYREELDDEEVIVHSVHFAREAVILQPDTGVGFAVVLDDVAWRSKCFGKRASCTALPNAFGSGPSGLRLRPSWLSRPPRCGFHTHH